ncbi:MAG TPA: glutathione S-transferase family protein [Micropepsaceae bacterium]|nr:glutathione S-transferase family protein [Micropepsaceae bacterium]
MTIKIYGSAMSRAARVMWCAKELGLDFEHVDVAWDSLKKPEFLAINPNGKVPGFSDGKLNLFESLAINLYLAKKYGTGELYPTNIEDEARTFQWTLWAATEVEGNLLPKLLVKLGIMADAAAANAAAERARTPLLVLDQHLNNREWIVTSKFSIADLNVASVVAFARYGEIDISYAPHVVAWLDRCLARQTAPGANA